MGALSWSYAARDPEPLAQVRCAARPRQALRPGQRPRRPVSRPFAEWPPSPAQAAPGPQTATWAFRRPDRGMMPEEAHPALCEHQRVRHRDPSTRSTARPAPSHSAPAHRPQKAISCGSDAQSQGTHNPLVPGSSPGGPTTPRAQFWPSAGDVRTARATPDKPTFAQRSARKREVVAWVPQSFPQSGSPRLSLALHEPTAAWRSSGVALASSSEARTSILPTASRASSISSLM